MEEELYREVGARPSSAPLPAPGAAMTSCGRVLSALDAFFASYAAELPALSRTDVRRIYHRLDAYAREVDDDASRKPSVADHTP